MEKSIGREKAFLGLTLEQPPNFDYEILPIVHNKKYTNTEPERSPRGHHRNKDKGEDRNRSKQDTGRSRGDRNMKKSRDIIGKGKKGDSVRNSRLKSSDDEYQTGVKKQELGFGNDKIENPVNFDQLMTKDRKMKYQTGNALKNLDNAGPPMPKDPVFQNDDAPAPEKKKKKKKKKVKAKAKKTKTNVDGEYDDDDVQAKKKKDNNKMMEDLMFKK